jgi:hypothetical protein
MAKRITVVRLGRKIMNPQNYEMEASLYYKTSANLRQKTLVFRRFERAADAIRFAIEEKGTRFLEGCSLEVNDEYYFGREIRPLYDDLTFPKPRRARSYKA